MTDRAFTHPNFGHEIRVETCGKEVRLTFVANTPHQADDFALHLLEQLKRGSLHLTLMGKPIGMEES